ncbi:MAG TPA: DUF998 domain-containing protein [Candidatus Limnocylindria bacterium]|nr:DUF998 domain-containing protein [Candidatus Limnocylindria bacterium]
MSTHAYQVVPGVRPHARSWAADVAASRLAGVVLLALAAGFLTVIMLGGSIAPNYDYENGALSDLGVIPETALLFNGTLVAIGTLNIIGGYLLYRSHGRAWILTIFILGGIGAVGAGLFPLSSGDLHSLFALFGFAFFNLEAVAAATVLPRPMNGISLFAGIAGTAFVVLMVIGDAGNTAAFGVIGHGGTERMIVYPVMLWLVALGGYLIAQPSPDTR